jgi:hypothetical protein
MPDDQFSLAPDAADVDSVIRAGVISGICCFRHLKEEPGIHSLRADVILIRLKFKKIVSLFIALLYI